MHYFLDTEFTQLPWSGAVELISIGIVNENGEEFYACVNDFDESNCSEFVQESVLPKLPKKKNRASSDMAKSDILSFVTNHGDKISNFWCLYPTKKELRNWGLKRDKYQQILQNYGDIDLQLLKHLLGDEYRNSWPSQGSNLVPLVKELKKVNKLPQNMEIHNALADAKWNRKVWQKYQELN